MRRSPFLGANADDRAAEVTHHIVTLVVGIFAHHVQTQAGLALHFGTIREDIFAALLREALDDQNMDLRQNLIRSVI